MDCDDLLGEEANDSLCVICLDAPRNAGFIHGDRFASLKRLNNIMVLVHISVVADLVPFWCSFRMHVDVRYADVESIAFRTLDFNIAFFIPYISELPR